MIGNVSCFVVISLLSTGFTALYPPDSVDGAGGETEKGVLLCVQCSESIISVFITVQTSNRGLFAMFEVQITAELP